MIKDMLLILLSITRLIVAENVTKITDEKIATQFLLQANHEMGEWESRLSFAGWNYETNITEINEHRMIEETALYYEFKKKLWENSIKFDPSKFKNFSVVRQFKKLSLLGMAALDEKDSTRFTNVTTQMQTIYNLGTIDDIDGKRKLELDPDLVDIMAESRDYDKLEDVWVKWRNAVGRPVRNLYLEYIKLGNSAAVKNGLKTKDQMWLFPYETDGDDFKSQIKSLWKEVEEFYQKLHAYVRMTLRERYSTKMPNDGTIPAHLLGNMWSQSWDNIYELMIPFPNKSSIDLTKKMKEKNFTVSQMFQLSDKFFRDLGLIEMPKTFWEDSMFEKPKDRKVDCWASAMDFLNQKDFRIKMCTDITKDDLVTVHHEMGHIEYFMQYRNQPVVFREGANPGFHEAIGDLMALSVSTPGHLHSIDLLDELIEDTESKINYQLQMALKKCAFMPFAYIMDLWRWDIFSGSINTNKMNRHWWELRLKYQGVSPPVKRSEKDFDPAAKFHIIADIEYLRYFVAHMLQFSFHEALCKIAQPNVPLDKCDINGNRKVGEKLMQMMRLGSSVDWPEQLEIITGNRRLSARAMLNYFQPLIAYLDDKLVNETIGWKAKVDDYMEDTEFNVDKNNLKE